ncbi:MAG: hypothetical protein C4547_05855 [Phycisphaerales bacterium]|nr:MAG: hypothetical protein C4547_05855 [Phycisphaerales bacterium]
MTRRHRQHETRDGSGQGVPRRAAADADELFTSALRAAYPWDGGAATDVEPLARRVAKLHRRRRVVRRTIGCVACPLAAAIALAIILPRVSPPGQPPRSERDDSAWMADRRMDARSERTSSATGSIEAQARPDSDSAEAARAQIARLRAEADAHARIAGLIAAAMRRMDADAADVRTTEDPLASVERELNTAGLTLVRQADEMARNDALIAVAETWYRRTIDRFPGTFAADLARRRLGQLAPDA